MNRSIPTTLGLALLLAVSSRRAANARRARGARRQGACDRGPGRPRAHEGARLGRVRGPRRPARRARRSRSSTSRSSSARSASLPATPTARGCSRCRSSGRRCKGAPALVFRKGGEERKAAWHDDYVAWTKRVAERVSLDASELVFVGYGVQAPEFQWDDYKGVDLRGQDDGRARRRSARRRPEGARPARPCRVRRQGDDLLRPLDLQVRDGREDGARRASSSSTRRSRPATRSRSCRARWPSSSTSRRRTATPGRSAVEGWITLDAGQGALRDGRPGLRRAQEEGRVAPVHARAARRDRVASSLENTIRRVPSANVVARLEGRDPAVRDEYVAYSTHWDHFGIGPAVDGDTDLPRCPRQRERDGRPPRDRARPRAGRAAAAAVDPLPLRHRRGAGSPRLDVLRDAPALPAREDARRPQPRRR